MQERVADQPLAARRLGPHRPFAGAKRRLRFTHKKLERILEPGEAIEQVYEDTSMPATSSYCSVDEASE